MLNRFILHPTVILNSRRHIVPENINGEFREVNSQFNFGFELIGTALLLRC